MFWMKRNKLVHLQHLTAAPGKKSPQGRGKHHMEIKDLYFTIKGNARLKTLTIRAYDGGKLYAKYRSLPQTADEYNYYTQYATQSDIKEFLKIKDYYVIR